MTDETSSHGIILTGAVDRGHFLTGLKDSQETLLASCVCGWTLTLEKPITYADSRRLQRRFDEHVDAAGEYHPT